jgi:hypothetical protein
MVGKQIKLSEKKTILSSRPRGHSATQIAIRCTQSLSYCSVHNTPTNLRLGLCERVRVGCAS